jgi:hypothetical protein
MTSNIDIDYNKLLDTNGIYDLPIYRFLLLSHLESIFVLNSLDILKSPRGG